MTDPSDRVQEPQDRFSEIRAQIAAGQTDAAATALNKKLQDMRWREPGNYVGVATGFVVMGDCLFANSAPIEASETYVVAQRYLEESGAPAHQRIPALVAAITGRTIADCVTMPVPRLMADLVDLIGLADAIDTDMPVAQRDALHVRIHLARSIVVGRLDEPAQNQLHHLDKALAICDEQHPQLLLQIRLARLGVLSSLDLATTRQEQLTEEVWACMQLLETHDRNQHWVRQRLLLAALIMDSAAALSAAGNQNLNPWAAGEAATYTVLLNEMAPLPRRAIATEYILLAGRVLPLPEF